MVKYIVVFAVGAALGYYVPTHPKETSAALDSAKATAMNGAESAVNSAQTAIASHKAGK